MKPLERSTSFDLVVAHYNEDVGWAHKDRFTKYSPVRMFIYDKGKGKDGIRLPNVGREAHTYLWHIVNNYDQLADVTAFLQGKIRDHAPHAVDQINNLHRGSTYKELTSYELNFCASDAAETSASIQKVYRHIFGVDIDKSRKMQCKCCACFVVIRDRILSHPRDLYERAIELTEKEVEPECFKRGPIGCAFERLWHLIFNGKEIP